ncbi:MAG: permease, partial [Phycisphaerae bacterium]|nr:permease [Phycisphaerae bacterium]
MPEEVINVLAGFWGVLGEMAPYLLFGFFVAGVLSVLISPTLIERHLGGGGFWPVLKAAAFGVPLPLCSCGVIPVAALLRRHGTSRGATTSFLIATPQDGVDSIFVTFSLLGGVFAIFRPIVAVISGVVSGNIVDLLDRKDGSQNEKAQPHQDIRRTDT